MEFTVAWVISQQVGIVQNLQKFQNYADGANFDNFTSGYRELEEIHADCMNFA